MRWLALMVLLAWIVGCVRAKPQAAGHAEPNSGAHLIDEVWDLVNQHFFDPSFHGVDWPVARMRAKQRAADGAGDAVADIINDMLAELGASHTRLYPPGTAEYFELLDIYRLALGDDLRRVAPDGVVRYGRFAGAADVDGREGRIPHEVFLDDMRRTARVIERGGRRIACVRIRSWAGEEFQRLLVDLVNAEPLRSCDGLLLDLRGGWGGANPEYITLLGCPPPELEMTDRAGRVHRVERESADAVPPGRQWRTPAALLVDEGTRSGKEIIAFAFRACDRGPIIGTRTAGAVVGGRPFLLRDGSLLIVAVADVRVNGVRLEGVGVEPDVVVQGGAPGGDDVQLDRAVDALFTRWWRGKPVKR